ncbi:MAG: S8 family serine peptidase [Myxococcota bacterium]
MRINPTKGLALLFASASAAPAYAGLPEKLSAPLTVPTNGTRHLSDTQATESSMFSVRLSLDPVTSDAAAVRAEQDAFLARHPASAGFKVIGRTQHVLNAVFLQVTNPAALAELDADPAAARVTPVANYEKDLSETVPYIQGTAVQNEGIDGTGVTVAVLDSGVDYLHADLGGSGSVADYEANDRNVVEPGSFPTAKVVGGFDFVGEVWPTNGPLQPDPDPLDLEGHGTHVADIIAGNLGVAPGASILAVKVCSAISSSCNGIALIQGMDFAVDPNGDGDTSDHVDIINMSLGSSYGQPFDDDLVLAVENATRIGSLTVASAGNGGDEPYVTGTPAAAESALSVAQTSVPSALQDFMQIVGGASVPAVFQPWSTPLTAAITGAVIYGDGAGGNLNGCAAFPAGTFAAGSVVLVDRGACAFSVKIGNIAAGGGALGIIGLIDGSTPFAGSFGGGTPTVPGFMISLAAANAIRGGATVTFDPANAQSLAGSMVSSSSRGPRNRDSLLKPEIGAPGASLSAEATTGTTRTTFGGTSGAAPMVSGAAALLKESKPWATPWELKLFLMNGANPDVARDFTAVAAEVSRIGAGEVDAFRSFESQVRIDVDQGGMMGVAMGFVPVADQVEINRTIHVINDAASTRTFSITPSFRFADDAASGAVDVTAPASITVAGNSVGDFNIRFVINGANLPNNSMTSGVDATNPATLTAMEFDGYIRIADAIDDVSVPWHILPRKSADVIGERGLTLTNGTDSMPVTNFGAGTANADAFTLLAVSDELTPGAFGTQQPTPDLKAVGYRTIPVPAGFCSADASFLIEFAFNSWRPQTNVIPVIFQAEIDTDNDGEADFIALNGDFDFVFQGGTSLDGRSVSIATDVAAGTNGAFFFAAHSTNTANTVITYCAEQFGMTAADLGTREITVTLSANDFYFGGPGDELAPITFTVGGGLQATIADIAPASTETMTVTDAGGTGPDVGIMLINNGDRGAGNRGAATPESETLLFLAPGNAYPD